MTTRSEAFAAQAASDLDVYDILAISTLPRSHRLHCLQMWLEKLCKAYLWLPEAAADDLRSKHNVVDKVLPRIIQEHWRRIGFTHRPKRASAANRQAHASPSCSAFPQDLHDPHIRRVGFGLTSNTPPRAPPYGLGDARARFSDRIDNDPLHTVPTY